ncbi:MAG: tetratricopeptide repeat protein [Deltaproteobacteria bacterium]|nr:tetratricopeptide repeat protein [Deltaproteobacteria bacterium]
MKNRIILLFFFSLTFSSLPLFAKSTDQNLEKAYRLERRGDYDGALKVYNEILKGDPESEPALLGAAQAAYWNGNYQTSIQHYEKVLAKDPEHIEALMGVSKSYLAVGEEKKAKEALRKVEKVEPENKELEALEPQLEKKTRMFLGGGMIVTTPSYATQYQTSTQTIMVQKERSYGFGLRTAYVDKFNNTAFDTNIFANIYILEKTRIDGSYGFSPGETIVAKQNTLVGLAHTFGIFTPKFEYGFQDYAQANIHLYRPSLLVEPFRFLRMGGGYEHLRISPKTAGQDFGSYFAKLAILPIEWIQVYGDYKRKEDGFEGGRTPTPFVRYKAHVFGGGALLDFQGGLVLDFSVHQENRNNNESTNTVAIDILYSF